jgi:hypothetical protein
MKEFQMGYGLSLAELEGQSLDVLPSRNTMGLIDIDSLTLLNGLNVLNGNNIGVIANVLADGNKNSQDQTTSSNDLVTCIMGHAFEADDSCSAN